MHSAIGEVFGGLFIKHMHVS